ncbi:unnamed protein product [Fusarium langsethiae]|nr:unnamed protein product [Fusarium langsethiae]
MVATLQRPQTKTVLFPDQKKLQSSNLRYAGNFNCRLTKHLGKPGSFTAVAAPVLWWLWDPLSEWFGRPYTSPDYTLEFTPVCKTGDGLSNAIKMILRSKDGLSTINLTAKYGGEFDDRDSCGGQVTRFDFQKRKTF